MHGWRRCGLYIQWNITQTKKWNNATFRNMDGPRDYHTKSDIERQILYDITYVWNQKCYE